MKIKMTTLLFLVIVVLVILLLKVSDNNTEKAIYNKGRPTIGTINNFSKNSYFYFGGSNRYDYSYYNDNNNKVKGSFFKLGLLSDKQKKTIKKGDKFFVLYLPKKGSIILFDYPIKDSADFKRYVKEFEEMRKRENNK